MSSSEHVLATPAIARDLQPRDHDRRMLSQLKRVASDLYFTANHVGAPGCRVREKAADDESAVRWAIGCLNWRPVSEYRDEFGRVLTCRRGERGVNLCHRICGDEWVESSTGVTTVTHSTFAEPTHFLRIAPFDGEAVGPSPHTDSSNTRSELKTLPDDKTGEP